MWIRSIAIFFTFTIYLSCQASDTIYIVQEAWHTGIVIKTASVSEKIWPEIKNYTHYKYVDISWGDEKYYQTPGIQILLAARAILFPTNSVLRTMGFNKSLQKLYARPNIMQLVLDRVEMRRLCRFVNLSFRRNEKAQIIQSTVGNTGHFFLAKRKYHLFRTCNTWVLLALKKAGMNVNSFMGLTAGQLFRRLEKLENARYISRE